MENIYYCLDCHKPYESDRKKDIHSDVYENYLKFMGFCSEDCFQKLTRDSRQYAFTEAYFKGDIRKRKHKLKMLNN